MRLEILRRKSREEAPYIECHDYTPAEKSETVATALTRLNAALPDPIRWECSCLQKKCGACAMVVNGSPVLACDARLSDYKNKIRIEPLRKFLVVADLISDRSVLYENLRQLRCWLPAEAEMREGAVEIGYEASRCLQCGCCLEVCPNFDPGGVFAGMAGAVPLSRLLAELPEAERGELSALYRRHVYAGCGKSLACRNVCPAGIDVDGLLVNSNAAAVWKRLLRRKKH
ncbi:MAG: succinate dehydrogenase [Oscillospiraceae bacterium]|nr:succinate dehydrogenase [Oscillospiraceae bacterium]